MANFKFLLAIFFSDNLQNCVNEGKLNDEKCETALSLLTGVLDYERFKDVDMAIEARNQRTPFFYPTTFFGSMHT